MINMDKVILLFFLIIVNFYQYEGSLIKIERQGDNDIKDATNQNSSFVLSVLKSSDQSVSNFQYVNLTKRRRNINSKIPEIRIRHVPFAFPVKKENESDCLENSSEDFPQDIFTMEEKRNGAIILHFILAVYCFALLAVVCNDYFLPAVELICEKMQLSQDVAAATFMAIATSAPEFFVNIIGTFVTESDIGVGTIVGSSMFNTLGVAALGGLACKSEIIIDWWPITRDSIIYILTITMLVVMTRDEILQWYEAMVLLIFYVIYFIIMWQNERIYNTVNKIGDMFKRRRISFTNNDLNRSDFATSNGFEITKNSVIIIEAQTGKHEVKKLKTQDSFLDDEPLKFMSAPQGNYLMKAWWIFSWPIRLLLKFTIPDCRKNHCLFPFTFIMCVVWIGSNSYLISWMMTIIGATLRIPEFVMGVTFLAAGACLPEAISIVLVARKGQNGMGVSNSLGANTLDILLCLGLPWFIKAIVSWSKGGENYIKIDSDSLFYTIVALILAVLVLYVTISISGYKLSKKVGIILIVMYILFLSAAIALEMFLYYEGKLFPCEMV